MKRKSGSYEPKFRRRAEGKTNYRKRLAALKSGIARLVVRRSSRYIISQVINSSGKGDVVVAAANSRELRKFGWALHCGNTPSAYLTGLLCGTRAVKAGVDNAVLDIGLSTPVHGSAVFAVLKGAIDAGLKVPAGEGVFPSESRLAGSHIAAYAKTLSGQELEKKFSECIKAHADPRNAEEHFKKVKGEIIKKEAGKGGG